MPGGDRLPGLHDRAGQHMVMEIFAHTRQVQHHLLAELVQLSAGPTPELSSRCGDSSAPSETITSLLA